MSVQNLTTENYGYNIYCNEMHCVNMIPSGGSGSIGDIYTRDSNNNSIFSKTFEGNGGTYTFNDSNIYALRKTDGGQAVLAAAVNSTVAGQAVIGIGEPDTQNSWFFVYNTSDKNLLMGQNNACVNKNFSISLGTGNLGISSQNANFSTDDVSFGKVGDPLDTFTVHSAANTIDGPLDITNNNKISMGNWIDPDNFTPGHLSLYSNIYGFGINTDNFNIIGPLGSSINQNVGGNIITQANTSGFQLKKLLYDENGSSGSVGQVLTATATGTQWNNDLNTNIYNSDGSLSGTRTVTLAGNKLDFGPQSPTSPAQLVIDPSSNQIGMFSFNGQVNIGTNTQTSTNIESKSINLFGGTLFPPLGGITLDAVGISFPQQSNGILKTTSGILSAGAALNDLSDVIVSSPQIRDIIQYNGSNFVNVGNYGYNNATIVNNSTITMAFENIYISGNSVFNVPTSGISDIGRKIMICASQGVQCTITFPVGIFLVYNSTSYSNFSMNNTTGTVELICLSSNQYGFASITDRWGSSLLSFDQPFSAAMLSLGNLEDVDTTAPTNGQVLTYNTGSSKWVNATPAASTSGNYSPTYSFGANVTAISLLQGNYIRSGDIVTVNIVANITVNGSLLGSDMVLIISIPVNTNSGFSSIYSAPGTVNIYYSGSGLVQLGGQITATIAGNTVNLTSRYTLSASQSIVLMANFQYSVTG